MAQAYLTPHLVEQLELLTMGLPFEGGEAVLGLGLQQAVA